MEMKQGQPLQRSGAAIDETNWKEYVSGQMLPILYGLESSSPSGERTIIEGIIDRILQTTNPGADVTGLVESIWSDYCISRSGIQNSRIINSMDWVLYHAKVYVAQNS